MLDVDWLNFFYIQKKTVLHDASFILLVPLHNKGKPLLGMLSVQINKNYLRYEKYSHLINKTLKELGVLTSHDTLFQNFPGEKSWKGPAWVGKLLDHVKMSVQGLSH